MSEEAVYLTIAQLKRWDELVIQLNQDMLQLQTLADQVWVVNEQSQAARVELLGLVNQAKHQINKEDIA